uniref:Uncharacterized protein n=1 Tax=Cacopsylla melanoneura TaxID=428564 RepID=A0A8D8XFY6_9HEMI
MYCIGMPCFLFQCLLTSLYMSSCFSLSNVNTIVSWCVRHNRKRTIFHFIIFLLFFTFVHNNIILLLFFALLFNDICRSIFHPKNLGEGEEDAQGFFFPQQSIL